MNPLHGLAEHGQSVWIDNLTRRMVRSGELRQRILEQGLSGVTSNPTIFDKAISGEPDYEPQIRERFLARRTPRETYRDIVVTDVREACEVLRPIFDRSDGADGFVSLEVSPQLAHDTEATIAEAKQLAAAVEQPNVLIKIPGTPAGVPAIEQCLFSGVSVNITLLFAVSSYEAVQHAYLRALERRAAAGLPLHTVASVASFFLSRIDVLVDELLSQRFSEETARGELARPLLGKAAVANAKLAYQSLLRVMDSHRWRALARNGARPQRLVWASTGTKNPAYSEVKYVEPLIGPHTVTTMPEATLAAFADHGRVSQTIEVGIEESQQLMRRLGALGIRSEQVSWQLEHEGVRKFIEPYQSLLGRLQSARDRILDEHAQH